jgi:hypothetical protein
MGDKPLPASADKQGIIAKLASFISRACQIPPKTRFRFLSSSPRPSPVVKTFTFIFIGVLILFLSINFLVPALAPIYPDGPRLPEVIDEDFPLSPRKPALVYRPNLDDFYLESSEKLVIRDCTVYTVDYYAPRKMRKYDDTSSIIVQDSANLTLINVTFIPSASITVRDNASLKMINVTNYQTEWATLSDTRLWRLQTRRSITAIENATIQVEGSKIGVLAISSGSYVDCTVTNSYVERASLANEIPPRFVESEVYEMNDHVGNVELDGTAIGNGSRMALTVRSSLNKSTLKRGEPISATFRLENVGNLTVYIPSNGSNKFIIIYEKANVWNQTKPYDEPTPPAYHFPPRLELGQVFEQTLTWQNPPFQPGTYWIRCNFYFKSLSEFMGNKPYCYLSGCCGRYTITISEESWLG